MTKLIGNIRITANPASENSEAHFQVVFEPYAGHLNTPAVKVGNHEELVQFLIGIRLSEDEASRWAGRARSGGVLLISGIERTEEQLRDSGLLA